MYSNRRVYNARECIRVYARTYAHAGRGRRGEGERRETEGGTARMGKMGKTATDFDWGGIAYRRKGETAQMVR